MKQFTSFLVIVFLFFACEKENESQQAGNISDPNVIQKEPKVPEDILSFLRTPEGLTITSFTEEGKNKTGLFSGYLFKFIPDGTVIASNAVQKISGRYSVFKDDGKTELSMSFSGNNTFSELSDDWYFIQKSEKLVHFEDSGDILKFQKQ